MIVWLSNVRRRRYLQPPPLVSPLLRCENSCKQDFQLSLEEDVVNTSKRGKVSLEKYSIEDEESWRREGDAAEIHLKRINVCKQGHAA